MTERGVRGVARGPITPSPGSSPGVPVPFGETTTIKVLRRMLRDRDRHIESGKKWQVWWKASDESYYRKLDQERRLIRERIKALAWMESERNVMDVKEMREVAEAVSEHTACGCDPSVGVVHCPSCDARYLAKLMLVLTCPDPLTLDAAKAVMGREPDETFPRGYRGRWDWGETISLRVFPNGRRTLRFGGNEYDNPTIGQFAMLVAAARMGEKA